MLMKNTEIVTKFSIKQVLQVSPVPGIMKPADNPPEKAYAIFRD